MDFQKRLLFKCILFDLIGVSSYFIPVVGPFIDIIWAPIAAKLMLTMFSGRASKIASVFVLLEEITVFDFIPSFSLMWVFTYVIIPVLGKKELKHLVK